MGKGGEGPRGLKLHLERLLCKSGEAGGEGAVGEQISDAAVGTSQVQEDPNDAQLRLVDTEVLQALHQVSDLRSALLFVP